VGWWTDNGGKQGDEDKERDSSEEGGEAPRMSADGLGSISRLPLREPHQHEWLRRLGIETYLGLGSGHLRDCLRLILNLLGFGRHRRTILGMSASGGHLYRTEGKEDMRWDTHVESRSSFSTSSWLTGLPSLRGVGARGSSGVWRGCPWAGHSGWT